MLAIGSSLSGSNQKSPVNGHEKAHRRREHEESGHDKPFESAIMVIWIPSGYPLDPGGPEQCQEAKPPREYCECGLEPHSHLGWLHASLLIHRLRRWAREAVSSGLPTRRARTVALIQRICGRRAPAGLRPGR